LRFHYVPLLGVPSVFKLSSSFRISHYETHEEFLEEKPSVFKTADEYKSGDKVQKANNELMGCYH
jgi:hypothetical protein